MGNKRLINNLIIFLIVVVMSDCCKGQSLITIPKCIIFPSSNSVQFWDGTTIGTRQLTGFTITGSTISPPTAVDNSITNELQTLSTASNTVTLSNSGGSFTIAGSGTNTVGTAGTTITIGGAEVDGSVTNEGSLSISRKQHSKWCYS